MATGLIKNIEVGSTQYAAGIFRGTCATAAATTDKVVTCPEFTADDLVKGTIIAVTFNATNSGAVGSLTMNVNGTGAKSIKEHRNASVANLRTASNLIANETYLFAYDGTYWVLMHGLEYDSTYYTSTVNITTGAATAAKVGTTSAYTLQPGYFAAWVLYDNTAASAITLNVSSTGAKPIYINGTASSASNYSLKKGVYIAYYDGTNYYFNTNGSIPKLPTGFNYIYDGEYDIDASNTTNLFFVGTGGITVTTDEQTSGSGVEGVITIDGSGVSGTDKKVEQKAAISTNGAYPIILAESTVTTATTSYVNKSSNLKYNPSTKALTTGGTVDGINVASHTHSITTSTVATTTPSTANTGSTTVTPAGVVTGSLNNMVLTLGFSGTSDSHTHNLNSHTHNYVKATGTGTPQ